MEQNYLSFETKKHALEFLNSKESLTTNALGQKFWSRGNYYSAHGEYERPDYSPRRYKDGWGIHVTYYYYPGTLNIPTDGRVEYDIWE